MYFIKYIAVRFSPVYFSRYRRLSARQHRVQVVSTSFETRAIHAFKRWGFFKDTSYGAQKEVCKINVLQADNTVW
jgi:hypothetical protein